MSIGISVVDSHGTATEFDQATLHLPVAVVPQIGLPSPLLIPNAVPAAAAWISLCLVVVAEEEQGCPLPSRSDPIPRFASHSLLPALCQTVFVAGGRRGSAGLDVRSARGRHGFFILFSVLHMRMLTCRTIANKSLSLKHASFQPFLVV